MATNTNVEVEVDNPFVTLESFCRALDGIDRDATIPFHTSIQFGRMSASYWVKIHDVKKTIPTIVILQHIEIGRTDRCKEWLEYLEPYRRSHGTLIVTVLNQRSYEVEPLKLPLVVTLSVTASIGSSTQMRESVHINPAARLEQFLERVSDVGIDDVSLVVRLIVRNATESLSCQLEDNYGTVTLYQVGTRYFYSLASLRARYKHLKHADDWIKLFSSMHAISVDDPPRCKGTIQIRTCVFSDVEMLEMFREPIVSSCSYVDRMMMSKCPSA